jgi:hypothetical protein
VHAQPRVRAPERWIVNLHCPQNHLAQSQRYKQRRQRDAEVFQYALHSSTSLSIQIHIGMQVRAVRLRGAFYDRKSKIVQIAAAGPAAPLQPFPQRDFSGYNPFHPAEFQA